MDYDPRFPPVRILQGPLEGHGSDNFQRVPPRPLTAPGVGGFQRASGFPALPPDLSATPQRGTRVNDPHHYANIISAQAGNAAAIGTSQLVVPRNDLKRNFLLLRNTVAAGGANVLIDFGKGATAASPLLLEPQKMILLDVVVPQDDIWVIGDAFPWAVVAAYSTVPDNV